MTAETEQPEIKGAVSIVLLWIPPLGPGAVDREPVGPVWGLVTETVLSVLSSGHVTTKIIYNNLR